MCPNDSMSYAGGFIFHTSARASQAGKTKKFQGPPGVGVGSEANNPACNEYLFRKEHLPFVPRQIEGQ